MQAVVGYIDVLKFQFLIGTLKTLSRRKKPISRKGVSIPHRYSKNFTVFKARLTS